MPGDTTFSRGRLAVMPATGVPYTVKWEKAAAGLMEAGGRRLRRYQD